MCSCSRYSPRGPPFLVVCFSCASHFDMFSRLSLPQATQRRAAQRQAGTGGGGGRPQGAGNNILQFYTDDSPGLQVGPTTVLVASLSFVGVVVLLHILGKFRS
jgi:protein transport protein SEC61 subunit beta